MKAAPSEGEAMGWTLATSVAALSLWLVSAAPAAPRTSPPRCLALGDSYTIGESVAPNERWPLQLAELLGSSARLPPSSHPMDVEIIARTGWTVAELSAAIDRREHDNPPLRGPFDLVTLLIGVNDQYRGGSPDAYRPAFAAMLQRAIGFAGGDAPRVVVVSIPDWSVTPFGRRGGRDLVEVARQIRQFNEVNRDETRRAGARYVDITPESLTALDHPELVAGDGLHPSGRMYGEWARLVLPEAEAALGLAASR
jgi:lysophospholipase L1-like esterase